MSVKKIQRTHATGKTVYVIVKRDADGYLRNDADGSFAVAPADKYLSLVEDAVIKGMYEANVDDLPWLDGMHTIVAYDQTVVAPAPGAGPNPAADLLIDDEPQKLFIRNDGAAADPGTLLGKVQGLVKDVSGKLGDSDWTDAISSALKRYSSHNPKLAVVDLAGTGLHDYAMPAGWITGFSEVKQIEMPVGQVPEALLDPEEDYSFYLAPDGLKLRLITFQAQVGESLRVTITVPRLEADIDQNDLDAFANLAASICFEMLAARYVDTSDPTVQADVVNYRSKSAEATSRAKALLKFYKDHMGIQEDSDTPPSVAVSTKATNFPGGQQRLTHVKWARDRR